ncbi:MAG: hypothetical protein ABIZ69_05305, partial [Ilumatobacteraceae bacterium]
MISDAAPEQPGGLKRKRFGVPQRVALVVAIVAIAGVIAVVASKKDDKDSAATQSSPVATAETNVGPTSPPVTDPVVPADTTESV